MQTEFNFKPMLISMRPRLRTLNLPSMQGRLSRAGTKLKLIPSMPRYCKSMAISTEDPSPDWNRLLSPLRLRFLLFKNRLILSNSSVWELSTTPFKLLMVRLPTSLPLVSSQPMWPNNMDNLSPIPLRLCLDPSALSTWPLPLSLTTGGLRPLENLSPGKRKPSRPCPHHLPQGPVQAQVQVQEHQEQDHRQVQAHLPQVQVQVWAKLRLQVCWAQEHPQQVQSYQQTSSSPISPVNQTSNWSQQAEWCQV